MDDRLKKIDHLLDLGRYDLAEEHALKVYALFENSEEFFELLGRIYLGLKKYERVFEVASQGLAVNPQRDYLIFLQALSWYWRDELDKAARLLDDAIAMDPEFYSYHYYYACVRYEQLRYEEALLCVDRALELKATHVPSLNVKGDVLLALGRKDEAREIFDQALLEDATDLKALNKKATLLMEAKNYAEAEDMLYNTLALHPGDEKTKEQIVEMERETIFSRFFSDKKVSWLIVFGLLVYIFLIVYWFVEYSNFEAVCLLSYSVVILSLFIKLINASKDFFVFVRGKEQKYLLKKKNVFRSFFSLILVMATLVAIPAYLIFSKPLLISGTLVVLSLTNPNFRLSEYGFWWKVIMSGVIVLAISAIVHTLLDNTIYNITLMTYNIFVMLLILLDEVSKDEKE